MGVTVTSDPGAVRRLAIASLEAEGLAALKGAVASFDRVVQLLAYPVGAAAPTPGQLGAGIPFAEGLNHRTMAMLAGASSRDLRRVAVLLHVTACVQRIGTRCAALAALAPALTPVLATGERVRLAAELQVLATRRRLLVACDAVRAASAPWDEATVSVAAEDRATSDEDDGSGVAVLALAAAARAGDPGGLKTASPLAQLADLLDQINLEASYIAEEAISVTVGLFTEIA